MRETLQNKLAKIGINGKVAQFYLATLELGEATVSEIAKQSGIGRTTAYDILNRLQEEGLVAQIQKAGRTYVLAERPDVLIRKYEEKQRSMIELLPELLSLYGGAGTKPKVRYYEGEQGVLNVLYDTLSCRSRQIRAFYSVINTATTPGMKDMETYIKKRVAAGIQLKSLRHIGEEFNNIWPSSAEEMREVRFAKLSEPFAMNMFIYDEKVAIISTRQESFGMIIESHEFSKLQENLFNMLWEISKDQ